MRTATNKKKKTNDLKIANGESLSIEEMEDDVYKVYGTKNRVGRPSYVPPEERKKRKGPQLPGFLKNA